MPPQRTIPPAKAIKTERTHEENQERAYIAASRRSDRSLEARVESARRASEIHKRRTGRSLRVTEQDVVNEEMYEEEDDDLPMQYRRLTAHLQTGSADFNRRLAAYLTNHVAMRSALDQAITNSYAQQYPNAPQFAHNQQTMFPSPLMPQNLGQQPQQQSPVQPHLSQQKPHQQAQAQAQHSPHPYRHAPYPTPGAPGYRQHPHQRSISSTSSFHEVPGFVQNFSNKGLVEAGTISDPKSMSMPSTSMKPAGVRTPQPSQSAHPMNPSQSPPASISKKSPVSKQESLTPQPMRPPPTPQYNANTLQDFSPFSTALPSESQMLLGSSLDVNDPLTSMFMAGSESFPQPFYDFNSQYGMAKFHPSCDGMNSTLAPSALEISPDSATYSNPSPATTEPANTPPYSYNFDGSLLDCKGVSFAPTNSAHASGTVTPGNDGGWDTFINENSWIENPT